MRRILLIVIALVLVLVGGAVAAVFLIPTNVYKEQIAKQTKERLGREVAINGPVSINLFPTLSVSASDVHVANPRGFSKPDFASMGSLRVGVKFLPLLSRKVEVSEFILEQPKILLETSKSGKVNWMIGTKGNAPAPKNKKGGFSRTSGALPEVSLGKVKIVSGQAIWNDRASGHREEIDNINMSLSMPTLDSATHMKGSFIRGGTLYDVSAGLGSPKAFLDGQQTETDFSVSSSLFNVQFGGNFLKGKELAAAGKMNLIVPSLRKLAEANGSKMGGAADTFARFAAKGDVKVSPRNIRFTNAKLNFDKLSGTGSFDVNLGRNKPKITGNLNMDSLDVTPYMPPPPPAGAKIPPWSTDTFDLRALKAANGNFTVSTPSMKVRNIEFGPTDMKATLINGRLQANLNKTSAYGGTGTGVVVVNGRGKTPSFALKGEMTGVKALPLFTAIAKFKRLTGTGEINLDVLTVGNSPKALMQGLTGSASMQLKDGAIVGVNLGAVLRSATAYLANGALPEKLSSTENTDFTNLSGTFKLANGVAKNTDMQMLGPLVRVTGNGVVDFGNQTVDYHLNPKAVASVKGQGGKADLQGFGAPFRISGSWNNVKAGLDTQALQKAAANRLKKKAKDEASKFIDKNVGGDLGNTLKGFLGAGSDDSSKSSDKSADQPQEKTDEEKAMDALGGLFGVGSGKKEEKGTGGGD